MSANRASDFPSSWAKHAGAASETSGESWRRIFRDIGQIAEKRGKKRALCTLGVDGAVAAAMSEPLMRGGVSWGRWDGCCDGVQILRAGMRLAAESVGASTFLVILVLWLV